MGIQRLPFFVVSAAQTLGLAAAILVAWPQLLSAQVVIHGVAPAPGIQRIGKYVNAELGSDDPLQPGTLSQPYKTLNHALQVAWDTNGGVNGFIDSIFVVASATPIAPPGFGGVEPVQGWKTSSEQMRPPFPIRMINHVNVIGVTRFGAKPVITIDEVIDQVLTPYTIWPPFPEPKSVVPGASHCTLSNFLIDGEPLNDTATNASDWPAVHVVTGDELDDNIENFRLLGCDIGEWHDGVCLEATQDRTLAASIQCSTLRDAWPLFDMSGHAGLWVIGPGKSDVLLMNSVFRGSHDGVEYCGEGAEKDSLTVTNCFFEDNENGLEVVEGASLSGLELDLDVSNTVFLRHHNGSPAGVPNDPDGTPYSQQSTGAMLVRGTVMVVTATVRSCDFRGSGWGILWRPQLGSLDLGTVGSPGLNNFCLDFSPYDGNPPGEPLDPYRVCLMNQTTQTVNAVGNFWLPNNQGAEPNGHLTGLITATMDDENFYDVDPFTGLPIMPKPPGPEWGKFQPPFPSTTEFLRNYSISLGGTINFGDETPTGSPPDCSVEPSPPSCSP